METREILKQLASIKTQAMVSIKTGQMLLENATNLERKLGQDQSHIDGSDRRKVNQAFEEKAGRLMSRRKAKYVKSAGGK